MVTANRLEDDGYQPKYGIPPQFSCPVFTFKGVKAPLYRIDSQSCMKSSSVGSLSCIPEEQSILDSLLLAQWEDQMWKGHFKYDVTTSEIKVITGRRGFLVQLNEGWNVDHLAKPAIEFCQKGENLSLEWVKDHNKLLLCVASNEELGSEFVPSAAFPSSAVLTIINENPVEYGHVFLIPCESHRFCCSLDAKSLQMFARIAREINNCSFRLFYDYFGSGASFVYFQAWYFSNPLPVELMSVNSFFGDGQKGIRICYVVDYPIRTLLFESFHDLQLITNVLAEVCHGLLEKNIPYSLLINDCGQKVFLFPQLPTSARSSTISAWECGGYFSFSSRYKFDQATEDAMLQRLSAVSLDNESFEAVKQLCCRVARKYAICF